MRTTDQIKIYISKKINAKKAVIYKRPNAIFSFRFLRHFCTDFKTIIQSTREICKKKITFSMVYVLYLQLTYFNEILTGTKSAIVDAFVTLIIHSKWRRVINIYICSGLFAPPPLCFGQMNESLVDRKNNKHFIKSFIF